jgi:magnesium transporter
MITAWCREEGTIVPRPIEVGAPMPEGICWLDLHEPTEAERNAVSAAIGVEVLTRAEMEEIEASSRLYVENDVLYLTTAILVGADSEDPELSDLTLIVSARHLVIEHFTAPKSILIFAARARRDPRLVDGVYNALLTLLDAIADRTADGLEMTGRRVDVLSRRIFERPALLSGERRRHVFRAARERLTQGKSKHGRAHAARLREILYDVGRTGDMLHRSYHSITGMIRMTAFLAQVLPEKLNPEQITLLQTLQSDLKSLHDHADFMIQETTFLLDATLGQINNEQNDIFRLLSMASVLFMPSNLLVGFYGMNLGGLPGAHQAWWVWLVFGIMALTGILPLIYFKRRGWW